jgi:hypothetical protein
MEMVHMPPVARDCLARSRLVPPRLQPHKAKSSGSGKEFLKDEATTALIDAPITIRPENSTRRMVLVQNPKYKKEPEIRATAEAVTLNLYTLGIPGSCSAQVFNTILRVADVNAFHCGVEIFGREWSFQQTMNGGTGVFCCMPRKCHSVTYAESVRMGSTPLSHETVKRLLERLRREWRGSSYDLLKKNCCHFCQEFCQYLKVGSLPEYITSAATSMKKLEQRRVRCGEAFTPNHLCSPNYEFSKDSDLDEDFEILPAETNMMPKPQSLMRWEALPTKTHVIPDSRNRKRCEI